MSSIHETDRLILKTLTKDAAPLVLSFYEENRSLFEPWEPQRSENFYTLSYQKASLSAEYSQMAEGKLIRYWIFQKENPEEIIGSVCFQSFLRDYHQSCCLGYKFGRKYHHKGYAFESIQRGIETMFKDYAMHRVEAYIMPNNQPSLRLIQRLQFTEEGLARSFAKINGIWSDHKRFALLHPSERSVHETDVLAEPLIYKL